MTLIDNLAKLGISPIESESFEPFSAMEVAKIEATINVQLPEAYKSFLMTYGKSMFSTGAVSPSSKKPMNFCCFFGFEALMTAIDCLKDTLPDSIIPIADDSGDIVLCLGLNPLDLGNVYIHNNSWGWRADAERFMERGEPVPANIRYQTVELIASTFDEFVQSMLTIDEPD